MGTTVRRKAIQDEVLFYPRVIQALKPTLYICLYISQDTGKETDEKTNQLANTVYLLQV
jgi:hypothetical protein